MNTLEQQDILKSIREQYIEPRLRKNEERIESILSQMAKHDRRSMILIGCAYLEELCKNCVFETMTQKGRKEFAKRHNRELTFSSAATLLYSQDYISEEIFNLISYLRDIRNKFAHLPIIEDNHTKSIDDRTSKIRELLDGRVLIRDMDRIKSIPDIDNQLYYMALENMMLGLTTLEMFIVPNQKIGRLQFIKNEKSLRVKINIGELNEYSDNQYNNKFYQND